MGIVDWILGFIRGGGGAAAASTNPVSAVANAVGGVANAVAATQNKADHKQMLEAGKAEGVVENVAETEKRVAAAADARGDDGLRDDVKANRYRD